MRNFFLRLFAPATPHVPPTRREKRDALVAVSRGDDRNPGRPWSLDGHADRVTARTRSEARSAFKRLLGLLRLPAGLKPQPA